MIELPAAHIVSRGTYADGTNLLLRLPRSVTAQIEALCHMPSVMKSQQIYVKLAPPKRPRTTGERSQNHAIHGYATQIGGFTGDYKEDVIKEAKRRAVTHGYPTHEDSFGNIVPDSEKGISTVEAGYLIDELLHIASDLGLKEA